MSYELSALRRRPLAPKADPRLDRALWWSSLAVGWSVLVQPRYRSTAEVLLQGNVSEEIFSPDPETGRVTSANRSRVQTEIEVMKSRSVRDAVEEELDRRPKVSIRQRGDTDVVAITVTNADPDIAAEDAQTYAEVFVETRRQQLIDDLLNATTQVQAELDSIREQITAAQVPLVNHDAAIAAAEDAATRRCSRTSAKPSPPRSTVRSAPCGAARSRTRRRSTTSAWPPTSPRRAGRRSSPTRWSPTGRSRPSRCATPPSPWPSAWCSVWRSPSCATTTTTRSSPRTTSRTPPTACPSSA